MNFEDLLKKAIRLLIAKKKLASLVYIEKKCQGVEDIILKCDCKSCIDFNTSSFNIPPSVQTY